MIPAPPFRIHRQPLLVFGGVGVSRLDGSWVLYLDSESSETEQVITLWHEVVHLLLFAAGIPAPHDEALIDAIAARLAQACPEILQLCKLMPETK